MLRPRSRLGFFVRIALALALIVLVALAWIWNSGRSRLERAQAELLASGGPELPPQTPEITEGGRATAAWFAQSGDDKAWAHDELDSTRSIEDFLAAHGNDSGVVPLSAELRELAESLRITDEEIRLERAEIDDPKGSYAQIQAMVGGGNVDPLESLEYSRASNRKQCVRELLEQQQPLESWDGLSRAWMRSRGLAHPGVLAQVDKLLALEAFDPPAQRGFERYDLRYQNRATETQQVLLDALPVLALAEDRGPFARAALAALALGRLRARCWGLVPWKIDAWARMRACWTIRACLQFLPAEVDLRAIEAEIAGARYRAEGREALLRERAVGNEVFVDFRAGTIEASELTGARSLIERELVGLWLSHEQAGYLEMLTRAIGLAERSPFELSGGLPVLDEIGADLFHPRPWQVIRAMITPNFRGEALAIARLEAEQQLTLLCFAAWRDPASVQSRLAATQDPFTGKPLKMREENGVLVFWSVGEDLRDDEPGAEHGDDIVARIRLR